jgi:hypothetical protein
MKMQFTMIILLLLNAMTSNACEYHYHLQR